MDLFSKNLRRTLLAFAFFFVLASSVSAQYSTGLYIFDSEADGEVLSPFNDTKVMVDESVIFYANYSSDNGYNLSQVLWRSSDYGYGYASLAVDFDGDGNKTDFVYSTYNYITGVYQNGTQRFSKYDVNFYYSYGLGFGDFNNDGVKEIVSGSSNGILFVINATNGAINYQSTDYGSGYAFAWGDIDDDGKKDDFALATSTGYDVYVFGFNDTSNAYGLFWIATDPTMYVTEIEVSEIAGSPNLLGFVDFYGDEKASIYYGNGTRKWQSADMGDYLTSIAFFDQDSDGKEDEVAVTDYSYGVFAFSDTGTQLWTVRNPPYGGMPYETEAVDFDGDGIRDDVVVTGAYNDAYGINSAGTLVWSFQAEAKNYESAWYSEEMLGLMVVNLTSDPGDEIIVGGYNERFYVLNSSGKVISKYSFRYEPLETLSITETNGIGYSYSSEHIAFDVVNDTNGDGLPEILFNVNDGYVHYVLPVNCRININGRQDYMFFNYTSKLWEYYYRFEESALGSSNTTSLNWNVSCSLDGYESQNVGSQINVSLQNSTVNAYDQEDDSENNAGWLSEDLVVSGENTYFFANFTDEDNSRVDLRLDSVWKTDLGTYQEDVAAIDLDGDGLKEAFVFGSDSRLNAYYVNGTMAWSRYDAYYGMARVIKAVDLNGDGQEEVVGVSSGGYLYILDNDGNELYQTADLGDFYSMSVGDLNNDSLPDLVIGKRNTGLQYGILTYIYNTTAGLYQQYWEANQGAGGILEPEISFNSLGQAIVAFAGGDGNDRVYFYYGNGTYIGVSADLGDYVYSIEWFDWDSDGYEDELYAAEYVDSWVYDWNAVSLDYLAAPETVPRETEAFDYDGDGYKDDMLYWEYNRLSLVSGETELNIWRYQNNHIRDASLEVVDLDNDGVQDFMTLGADGVIRIINQSGVMVYEQAGFTENMVTETEHIEQGDYYDSGGGLAYTDLINNRRYVGYALYDEVGVMEVAPYCSIIFNDSASVGMNYNASSGLYYYNRTFAQNVSYLWNVTCQSKGHITQTKSGVINLNQAPSYVYVNHTPSINSTLDPGVTIGVEVNVSDVNDNLDRVILQYKTSSGNFVNVTMENQTLKGVFTIYNASFVSSGSEDIYTYRIWSNDSLGVESYSQNYTIPIYWDCTFAIGPVDFGQVVGFDETARVLNLSINNTGDVYYSNNNCTLAFRLSYNLPYGRVYFDGAPLKPSDTYTLNALGNTTVYVNATFLDGVNEETLNITVDDVYSRSSTGDSYSTGLMISSRGGPYLYQEVTSDSSYTLYLKAQNVSLTSRMRNVVANGSDEKSAFNVTYNWTLPTYFMVQNSSINQTYRNLSNNSFLSNDINITFNSSNLPSLSAGTYNITLYSTGVNLTDGLIFHANNLTTLSKVVTVTFLCYNQKDGICVAGCGYPTDPDCAAPSSGTGAGSGGGGGGDDQRETSDALFELLRGKAQQFILPISNNLSSAKIDIEISVIGPNAEYIELLTTKIDRIDAHSSKEIVVKITAPAYFSKGEHILYFDIRGKIEDGKSFYERKKVTLFIVEVTRASADEYINSSMNMINKMNLSGMKIEKVSKLLEEMNAFYADYNFEGVQINFEELSKIYKAAFEAKRLLEELYAGIKKSEANGIQVVETKKILYVGETAYKRGDYVLAVERLNEAKLSYALETKGEFNLYYAIKNNPVEFAGALTSALVLTLGSSTLIKFRLLKRKLRMLEEEEKLLLELMKVVQREAFEKNSMSMEEYQQAMGQYENKLSQTIEEKITVEAKILYMFKAKGKKARYGDERQRLIELIGDLQDKYLNKGTIETRIYENMLKSYSTRLSEIDESLAFLEAKKALKGQGLFSRGGSK